MDFQACQIVQLVRGVIGAKLGIGYGMVSSFLYRLNHYGITRDAYEEAVNSLK